MYITVFKRYLNGMHDTPYFNVGILYAGRGYSVFKRWETVCRKTGCGILCILTVGNEMQDAEYLSFECRKRDA